MGDSGFWRFLIHWRGGIRALPASVTLRRDYSAEELRRLAKSAQTISQGRRLLSLAAVMDGMSRADAARIGGMDRQTLRDWVHRFNEAGPDGLLDNWSKGPAPRLSATQRAEPPAIVGAGPAQRSEQLC